MGPTQHNPSPSLQGSYVQPSNPSCFALAGPAGTGRALWRGEHPAQPGASRQGPGRAGQDGGAARGRYRTGAALLLGKWLVYCVSKMGGKCLVQGRLVQE